MADDRDWDNFETGPFCRHWSDPSDCPEVCATCGHRCPQHEFEAPGECMEPDCKCKAWKESEAS